MAGYFFGTCSACCEGSQTDPCQRCYKIEYEWTITDCNGNPKTYAGTVLFRDGEIVCYDDPDVVAVVTGNDGFLSRLNYGDDCSGTPGLDVELDFLCDGTIVLDAPPLTDQLQIGANICCGEAIGTYSEDFFGDQQISVTISQQTTGECDCTGYTDVPP